MHKPQYSNLQKPLKLRQLKPQNGKYPQTDSKMSQNNNHQLKTFSLPKLSNMALRRVKSPMKKLTNSWTLKFHLRIKKTLTNICSNSKTLCKTSTKT